MCENEYQPQELKDDALEQNQNFQNDYPKIILMMLSKGKLNC